ncbi:hypothetical protein SAMN05216226_1315 [Halovenus aranensis]|uniref:DUF8168 domain-containing protein n=1 Tax=Halovenus aranensis TaxID=890420 RepID=A0A1G8ZQB9_9EURY|nr:hypothetical protein [Halovenus aranensis]SDK17268.1 hypothetical protein SAMN05216226_1315 [Halovenus aranensis]
MTENAALSEFQSDDDVDPMVAAYRHDAHKLNGEPHEYAPDTFAGVPVNQTVPHGADGDASALSRPTGQPEQTVDTHENHYRLSLLSGKSRYDPEEFTRADIESAMRQLLTENDPETIHRAWLESDIVSAFNESVYYPYTSLKDHTLLVAALLDNYRAGHEFANLLLVVDRPGEIVPHRTVYAGDRFTLRIDANANGQPWARLGSRPWRSWASTWKRLTAHPLDVDSDKEDMVLDANLRRIWSWSTALQYIEDYEGEVNP